MSTLVCDLRAEAARWANDYRRLREAGEPLLLFWPLAAPAEGMAAVRTRAELEAALEDERLACIAGEASLPGWLQVEDFARVLLRSAGGERECLAPEEAALVAALHAAGAEAVELLADAAAVSLAQSWHSGRRTGTLLL